jgi:hypothetical protein
LAGGLGRCPGGATDNSPPFQRWVGSPKMISSPAGTAEVLARLFHGRNAGVSARGFFRPSGTRHLFSPPPTVETAGYCRASLRDGVGFRFRAAILQRSNQATKESGLVPWCLGCGKWAPSDIRGIRAIRGEIPVWRGGPSRRFALICVHLRLKHPPLFPSLPYVDIPSVSTRLHRISARQVCG